MTDFIRGYKNCPGVTNLLFRPFVYSLCASCTMSWCMKEFSYFLRRTGERALNRAGSKLSTEKCLTSSKEWVINICFLLLNRLCFKLSHALFWLPVYISSRENSGETSSCSCFKMVQKAVMYFPKCFWIFQTGKSTQQGIRWGVHQTGLNKSSCEAAPQCEHTIPVFSILGMFYKQPFMYYKVTLDNKWAFRNGVNILAEASHCGKLFRVWHLNL